MSESNSERKQKSAVTRARRSKRDLTDIATVRMFIVERDRRRANVWAAKQNMHVEDAYGVLITAALDEHERSSGQSLLALGGES